MKTGFGKPGLNWLARAYLRKCRLELARHSALAETQTEDIHNSAVGCWTTAIQHLDDSRTKSLYAFCALALATYRTVAAETGSPELGFDGTRRTVAATLGPITRFVIRIWLLRWTDPLGRLKNWKLAERLQNGLGPSMKLASGYRTDTLELIVHECGFRDFFAMHGEESLTKVMCAYDHAWMNLMNTSRRDIKAGRSSALSLGDTHFSDFASQIHMEYRLFQRGILDEETYTSWEASLLALFNEPGGAAWWNKTHQIWPGDFQERVQVQLRGFDLKWSDFMPWYRGDG